MMAHEHFAVQVWGAIQPWDHKCSLLAGARLLMSYTVHTNPEHNEAFDDLYLLERVAWQHAWDAGCYHQYAYE